jgi:NNP family nitrate/nitrite transporter-like MFS transporter
VLVSTIWMHVAIRRMEHARHPGLAAEKYLSAVPDAPLSQSRSGASDTGRAMPQSLK